MTARATAAGTGSRHLVFGMAIAWSAALVAASAVTRAAWISNLAVIGFAICCYLALAGADPVAGRVLAGSLLAGLGLLLWDWVHIRIFGTLVYPERGSHLLLSPAYMPFAWGVTLAPLTYLGVLLEPRLGLARTALVAGVVGATFYSIAEVLAVRAGWWSYHGVSRVAGVAVYIPLTYLLSHPPSVALAMRLPRARAAEIPLIAAAVLAVCTAAAFVAYALAGLPFRS